MVSMSLIVPPGFAQNAALPPLPAAGSAQPSGQPPADTSPAAATFNAEQLDALLAPIALYPDQLLVQVLMASTYPLEIVAASRWLKSGDNAKLTGDALAKALASQNWDPSVKSLVPFPQVLDMMNQQLEWTQQLGYAVSTQQDDVMDSVQRLRLQAQQAGTLKSNDQQIVSVAPAVDAQGAPTSQQAIIIQPANPQVVFVPTYNPSVAFGTWPYPSTPPIYFPPPVGYNFGNALLTGLAFGAGVAVVGSLWGWATPRWGWGGGWYGGGGGVNVNRWGGGINVNTNRYNNITVNNVNRGNFNGNTWRPPANGPGRPGARPPGGPVGRPARGNGLPPNAIGRPNVRVPGNAVNRPNIRQGGGNRPNLGQGGGGNRPNVGQGNGLGGGNRPNVGQGGSGNRPNVGQGGGGNRPNVGQGGGNRPNIGQGGGSGGGNRPNVGQGGGNRPNIGQGSGNRPNVGQGGSPGGGNRPNIGQGGGGNRPSIGGGANRPGGGAPAARPSRPAGGGAFGGVSDGARAGQFQQRGAQSRNIGQSRPAPQARGGGGGGRPGGGGGGRPGGGGGGHGGGGRHR